MAQIDKMLCLFFVDGSLCKNLVRPAELACWVVHVLGQLVLVIVEISIKGQHPETCSIQQLFCVISTYVKKNITETKLDVCFQMCNNMHNKVIY